VVAKAVWERQFLHSKKAFLFFCPIWVRLRKKYTEVLSNYKIAFEEEQHSTEKILNAGLVVKSPGIPDKAPLIQQLLKTGVPVISEIEFAGRYTTAKTICITGSNGKTTTTLLAYHILKNAGLNVGLAGNVGKSFAWQVAEEKHDVYVIELSSFNSTECTISGPIWQF
jgi:UDP-N-acetylmuramoylalanine--D-glutamate ligase